MAAHAGLDPVGGAGRAIGVLELAASLQDNLRRSEQDTVLGRLGFERLAVLRTAP
jgi:hypothetical protein